MPCQLQTRAPGESHLSDPKCYWSTNPNPTGQVKRLDPGRPFVDSSPSNGVLSRQPYVKRWGNANDPARGDRHYYNTHDDCMVRLSENAYQHCVALCCVPSVLVGHRLAYFLTTRSPPLCNAQDPANAPQARFFSEFGFQGLPSIESLAAVSVPGGLNLYSDWFKFRQRYASGY